MRTVWGISRRGPDEISKITGSFKSRRHANAIFIWIPKTGGTSVYKMLQQCDFVKLKRIRDIEVYFKSKGRITFGHMSVGTLLKMNVLEKDFVESATKFTIVRNPYARAVSCYNHAGLRGYFDNWVRRPSFSEFLNLIHSGFIDRVGERSNVGLAFCNPQSAWLRGIEIDRIFRLETLSEELPTIREMFNCPALSLGHENRSPGLKLAEISAGDRKLIEEIYREDFERFGYEIN